MSKLRALITIELVPAAVLLLIAALYIFLLPSSPYWLDSPEFTASSFSLSLSHPPGHPLYEAAGKLFALLPLGDLAVRLNLFSTFCSLAALLFVMLACIRLMTVGFSAGKNFSCVAASLSVIPIALSPAWIHQATHAEVYSLEAALLAAVMWMACCFLVTPREEDKNVALQERDDNFRWMLGALFVFSLSLCNHPFISILVLPPLAAALGASAVLVRWRAAPRKLVVLFVVLFLGILVYVFVPIRGSVSPTIIMGRIETLGDVLWTLSAKVYQKSVTAHETGIMTQKGTQSLYLLLRESGMVLPFIAFGGFYFLLRKKNLLPFGVLVALTAAISMLSRILMPFDTNNPDVFGYMMIVLVVLVIAACGFFAAAARLKYGKILAIIILLGLVASAAGQHVPALEAKRNLSDCPGRAMFFLQQRTTDSYQPFSKVFSSFYSTSFLNYYDQKVTVSRPGLTYTAIPFLGYRGVASEAAKLSGEMKRVITGYLMSGDLQSSDIAYLALGHAVYVEPYPEIPDDFLPYMVPEGAGFLFFPQPVSIKDFKAATGSTNETMEELVSDIGWCAAESQTGRYLLWLLYNRSLVIARRGDVDGAIAACRLALKVFPNVPELKLLLGALEKDGKPITDAAPFLPPKVE
ncbi:MAG: DUF2723 domain-containing protein [Pseudomonadota bacterium]